ncbi:lipopolysaccharide biosynthesis protein [Kocuria rhizosphaericola]|uniref:lipopolysaccharide biosynthesis protein n=1 Tax=Kocuria rhizosphaericola TaxID=3376284 RepID=UPI0037AC2149
MLKSIWSLLERLMPRAASSALLILLAWSTSPEQVGIYTWGVLLYTFVVAVTDSAMRQVVMQAIGLPAGEKFVAGYQRIGYVAVPIGMLVFTSILVLASSSMSPLVVLILSPFAFAPLFLIANVRNIGVLQKGSRWSDLAGAQLLGSACLLAVGVPTILLLQSPFGSALGAVACELVVFLRCRHVAKRLPALPAMGASPHASRQSDQVLSRAFKTMSMYSGLAWGQGQFDRVLIGIFGGTQTLGVISVGLAIARALGDAVASSNANVLRSELSQDSSDLRHEQATYVTLRRGLLLAVVAAILMAIPGRYVFSLILGPEWQSSLDLVPLLSIAVVPSVLSWSSGVLHVHQKTGRRALSGPVVGNVLALPVAMLALTDLRLFALGVYLREIALIVTSYLLLVDTAPWTLLGRAIGYSFVLTVFLYVAIPSAFLT